MTITMAIITLMADHNGYNDHDADIDHNDHNDDDASSLIIHSALMAVF